MGVDSAGNTIYRSGWEAGSTRTVLAHGAVGGLSAKASGGQFRQGFMSSGFSAAMGPSLPQGNTVAAYASRMAVGGTASRLAGGSFANGAKTAAYGYMFNDTFVHKKNANTQYTEGPGKWVTTDVDKVGGRNLLQMIVNRTESLGDEGRVFGSHGKDFKNTVQDVTQKWRALSTSVVENLRTNGYISVDRTYGETRIIRQTFIEGPDSWQQSGKSWTWQPAVRNEEFELQRLQ